MSMLMVGIEPIVRPKDYGCLDFAMVANLINRLIRETATGCYLPRVLVRLLVSFVVWKGPAKHMHVDVYWPTNKTIYKGVVINVHAHDKSLVLIRYVGWTKISNDWCSANLHPTEPATYINGRRAPCLFPARSCTFLTIVMPQLYARAARLSQEGLQKLPIGGVVIYQHLRHQIRAQYFVARVVSIDRDCVPLQIKIDRGDGHYLHVAIFSLRQPRKQDLGLIDF